MVQIYLMDVTPLAEEKNYQKVWENLLSVRQKKAEGYRFLQDRCRSLGVGELLRQACAEAGIPYEASSFFTDEAGKPDFKDSSLHFSLSHAGKYALCVVSDRVVGCDVEEIRPFDGKIAEKCFAEAEKEALSQTRVEEEKQKLFFEFWTMKESFVKCTGRGMSLAFDRFSVEKKKGQWILRQAEDSFFYVLGEKEVDGYQISWCERTESE